MRIPVRGTAAMLTAVAIVIATLIFLPAYRLFFAISLGIGFLVAAALYLWNKFHPVGEKDIENKRPLGLD
jgi:cytosine/uracil/thiamine/allantoin permease